MTAHHCSLFESSAPATGHPAGSIIPMADLLVVPAVWRDVLAAPVGAALMGPYRSRMLVLATGPLVPVARAFAALREEHQWGATDALPADEPRIWREWDVVLAVSATGSEPELQHALRHLPPSVPRVGVVAPAGAHLGMLVDELVTLPAGVAASSLAFETALLLAVRSALGDANGLDALAALAEQVLTADIPESAPALSHLVLVGSGWTGPLAARAAHVVGGSPRIRVESFATADVRYGALAHAGSDSLIWFLGRAPRDGVEIAQATGAMVTATTRDPLVDFVAVHRLARELAAR